MSQKRNNRQGNVYDRIFRENAGEIFIPLIEQKLNIQIASFQELQEKFTKTIERETDFLYQVLTIDQKKFLLHIEFQTTDDKEMLARMAEYHGLIYKKHKLPIQHIVIYLGASKPNMQSKLRADEIFWGFDLINIHDLNTTELLRSQIPEVILLALLSNYETERTEAILRLIITKLKAVSKSTNDLHKYLQQLILLSRLRKLEDTTIKILSIMPITYDISTDYLYQQGIQKGEVTGLQKGIQKGLQKGIQKGLQKGVEVLIRVGALSDTQIAEEMGVTIEFVKSVRKDMNK